MRIGKMKFLTGILGLLLSHASFATLIGDTVECTSALVGASDCSAASAVVGAGAEFSIDAPAPGMFIDIGASSIQLTGNVGTNWFLGNLFTLSDLDWIGFPGGFITNVILSDVIGVGGDFLQSDISFTEHSVSIDPSLTNWDSGSSALLTIVVDHNVPAPATLALFGLGLAGLGWSKRKKA